MTIAAVVLVAAIALPTGVSHGPVFLHWNDVVVQDGSVGQIHEAMMICLPMPGFGHIVRYLEIDGRSGPTRGDAVLRVVSFRARGGTRVAISNAAVVDSRIPADYQLRD